jgi:hypothetical protein
MSKTTQIKVGQKSKKRKGIHAKSKISHLKGSKNYKKPYRGQGK